jgi:Domain of unknown function (DUF4954)
MTALGEEANSNDFTVSVTDRRRQLAFTHKIRSLATSRYLVGSAVLVIDDDRALRKATAQEIATLKGSCGCTCKDWSKVCLMISPTAEAHVDQSEQLKELVSQNHFDGTNVLVVSPRPAAELDDNAPLEPWRKCPQGIHSNRVISNSIISTQSWVTGNMVLCDTHIHEGAVVMCCGSITASKGFIDDLALTVGPESGGGRHVLVQPESDMMQVCQQLTRRAPPSSNVDDDAVSSNPSPLNVNVVSRQCTVRDTPTIQGIYMSPNSSIHAATSVKQVVMLPKTSIQNSCTVNNARLQWMASIVDNSHVSDTLLMEEAHIGPNSLVASSILGPDVHISAGECHCSVIGPNTNAHHQSLCISLIWPLGRGNVGYGANIGSNHTGRIPDQEVASGEGVFWGLSCVIKFPVDMTMAPYSIIAAGTTVPPQRICMPFSLIVSGADNNNNNIIPGWVLSSSPYTIARSEVKYSTRRKAKRHSHYTGWKIIRPETISMCNWARKQLQTADLKSIYVADNAIPGIGDNIVSEKGRLAGIKAYTECIQRFALDGLLLWMVAQEGANTEQALKQEFLGSEPNVRHCESVDTLYEQVAWPLFPWEACSRMWSFQKSLLQEEFPMNRDSSVTCWVSGALEILVTLENNYASNILKCKKRDDERGAKTVPGYAGCHTRAEEDPVVTEAMRRAREVEETVGRLVGTWKSNQRSKL